MHRVFISYHHANDQDFNEPLVGMACRHGVFAPSGDLRSYCGAARSSKTPLTAADSTSGAS